MAKKNTRESRAERAERAAAALAAQRRREARRRNLMIAGVVAAVLVILVGGFLVQRARDTSTDVSAPAAGGSQTYGVTVGDPKAPHEVIIYEDFLCPFCGELEKATHADLTTLADDGKVYVEYRPFNLLSNLGDYSERSANAFAVVLDQDGPQAAKKMHDLLYENQPEESGPFLTDDQLVDLAVQAGADEQDVRGPIEDLAQKDWVQQATKAASDAGVQGTPTVLLDGKVYQDGRTVDELAKSLLGQVS
jgi:protein-disulfide isomerase